MGCNLMAAKLRAVARSEPRCSLVRRDGEAEPVRSRRRQQASTKLLDSEWSMSSPGVAGTARSERKALNVGDLVRCGLQPQLAAQGREPRRTGRREVGGFRSTDETDESQWREGNSLSNAHDARKERGLWQH